MRLQTFRALSHLSHFWRPNTDDVIKHQCQAAIKYLCLDDAKKHSLNWTTVPDSAETEVCFHGRRTEVKRVLLMPSSRTVVGTWWGRLWCTMTGRFLLSLEQTAAFIWFHFPFSVHIFINLTVEQESWRCQKIYFIGAPWDHSRPVQVLFYSLWRCAVFIFCGLVCWILVAWDLRMPLQKEMYW